MEFKTTVYLCIFLANSAFGQVIDPLRNDSSRAEISFIHSIQASDDVLGFQRKKLFFVSGNVTLVTFNVPPTDVEKAIVNMENLECKALLSRDTAALRNLWLRDFTLDAPQNDLLLGNNPIPYYVSLSRFVEKLTILDDMVITSGTESFILLNTNGKVEERKERTFTHSWSRENFSWRLATKIHPAPGR